MDHRYEGIREELKNGVVALLSVRPENERAGVFKVEIRHEMARVARRGRSSELSNSTKVLLLRFHESEYASIDPWILEFFNAVNHLKSLPDPPVQMSTSDRRRLEQQKFWTNAYTMKAQEALDAFRPR